MKNLILFLLIGPSLLIGEETSCPSSPTAEKSLSQEEDRSFFYANSGMYYAGTDVKALDLGVGYRNIHGFSGFDINIGTTWIDPVVPFVQGSYLFYPLKGSGPYTGLGISFIPYTEIFNFPLIIGYQTSNKDHPVFTQFQYSMFTIPGGTLSFGVGF